MNKKEQLEILFFQLKKSQQILFNMMYGSIESISDDKVDWAIKQVERTLEKNINKLDQKIDKILTPNVISQLPKLNISKEPKEPKYCMDGKTPQSGDLFYYHSKYSKVPIEGQVSIVYYDSIRSVNGASYKFSEITIRTKGEMRDEKINNLFDKN